MTEVSIHYSSVSQALGRAYGRIAQILSPHQIITGVNNAASGVKRLLLQRFIATYVNPVPASIMFQINGTEPHMRPGFMS